MKKATKLLALILAGLMLCSSFVACGGDDDVEETTAGTAQETEPETEEEVDPIQLAIDTLKQTVNYGGKDLTIMYAADIGGYAEEVENIAENGSVINEAVYKRNNLFESTLS